MTASEVTIAGPEYWAGHVGELARLLASTRSGAIRNPSGRRVDAYKVMHVTLPAEWARSPAELRDAVLFALGGPGGAAAGRPTTGAGAVAPVEQRLVYTVEEAAKLLGISRTFAYEAVQRGDIPSMRIGRRILVPKAALTRLLEAGSSDA
ncbi:MAG: helix-turn-helix domain-containing protein [Acidimicrobiales bacterium]|jgi:excisionase family DNA binding protein